MKRLLSGGFWFLWKEKGRNGWKLGRGLISNNSLFDFLSILFGVFFVSYGNFLWNIWGLNVKEKRSVNFVEIIGCCFYLRNKGRRNWEEENLFNVEWIRYWMVF